MTTQNGFAIRGFRQNQGLDVINMADILGISAAHYRKIEAETREAQPGQLATIARAVHQPVAALVRTPPGQPALSAPTETVSGDTRPLLMTEPYDGHEDTVRCPGCPHPRTVSTH